MDEDKDMRCQCGGRILVGWNTHRVKGELRKTYTFYCTECAKTVKTCDMLD